MTQLLYYPQMIISFIVPMIVLLGVLIFIHELGHFLVAKYFNVKVETFSLGFGPKIWKYVRGETTYCISAIPFGGYVKMFGDELGKEVAPEMQKRSFLHKPIYQKILIALAGPIMNLGLAFLLFVIIGLTGERVIAPQLGDISENTAAHSAGFRSGDKILTINDQPIGRWEDVDNFIEGSNAKPLTFKVQRENSDEPVTVTATPTATESKNPFRLGDTVGDIEGFEFISNSSLIAVSDPASIFGQLGFQTGDRIVTINNFEVNTFRNVEDVLLNESSDKEIVFKIERYGTKPDTKPEPVTITWDLAKIPFPDSPKKLGFLPPETFIGNVSEDSPAKTIGIQVNDRIVRINGTPIQYFNDIVKVVSSYKETDPELSVEIVRNGETKSFSLRPKMTEIKSDIGLPEKRFAMGIVPLKSPYVEYATWHADSLGGALGWGAKKTWQWTHATIMSFVLLAQNKVSPKNLGGFISIGQMAQKSWEMGLDAFLRIMAIISLNLFILNLLPIPVLDGGHILVFSIEAIKGAPLSLKKLEVAQQIGALLLLSLLAFSLFNDVSRLFGAS
ncbi:MAG: RIP metalloprotease RseP [Bdellovibrionales bacterium]|nr:RIP metalloprotease RseP [Bdellovibrionales bacterium]